MSKAEFLKELEALLLDISMEERQEALQYYDGYFEDAGPDHEQSIITELGSPAKVAACIKADLNSSSQEAQKRGYFTEHGYEDDSFQDPKYEILNASELKEQEKGESNSSSNTGTKEYSNNSANIGNADKNNWNTNSNTTSNNSSNTTNQSNSYSNNASTHHQETKQKSGFLKVSLIILICLFAIPVGIPLIVAGFALFLSVFITVAAICFSFIIISTVFVVIGVLLAILGLVKLITLPAVGICIVGAGLLLFGIGILFTIVTIWLCKTALPAIFRFLIDICRLPFHKRSAMA